LDQGQGLGGRLQGGLGRGQGGVCSQLAQLAGGVLGVCRGRAGGLPGDAQQVLVGAPGAEGGEGDLAGGEGADAPQRGALLIGEGQREALALAAQGEAGEGGAAFAVQGDPAPGEGQAQGQLALLLLAWEQGRQGPVQGGVAQGRVQPVGGGFLALLGGQGHLGVDLPARL